MASARHKHVLRSVKPRRRLLHSGLAAAAVTTLAISAGVATTVDQPAAQSAAAISQAAPQETIPVPVRVGPVSRSEDRVRLKEKPPRPVDQMFATTRLNVRAEPSEQSPVLFVLDPGDKIAVSGEQRGEWAEVVVAKKSRWVFAEYLSEKKPKPEDLASAAVGGISAAACASGSDVEVGLVPNAIAVHRAVCAAFPEITSYGGLRPGDDGEHGTGQALDIMISGDAGWEVAEFVRANAAALGVSEVLYSQKIWTVQRSSEGWRWMDDMGSTTANHYDHVHVTVY